ncbi:hypothetical protein [Micromonospora sp. CB01531]|uniref:hypothetical protein n=1 Tax=Micromonospora sp. CB01531 TaxID=1718947 RepID=UPI003FD62F0E
MDPGTVAIAVAVITTLGGGWSFFDRRKVAKENRELQKQQVEAQAYDRARAHYDAIIDDLTQHIAWLKSELASATEENSRLKERIEALEKTIEALRTANVIVIEPPKGGR